MQVTSRSIWSCMLMFLSAVAQFELAVPTSMVHLPNSSWQPATATWYGAPEGDGSDGGACGYGSLVDVKPFRARVGAVSPVLFQGC
ncbi:unnamed protein product [Rhodiola kirilowii]